MPGNADQIRGGGGCAEGVAGPSGGVGQGNVEFALQPPQHRLVQVPGGVGGRDKVHRATLLRGFTPNNTPVTPPGETVQFLVVRFSLGLSRMSQLGVPTPSRSDQLSAALCFCTLLSATLCDWRRAPGSPAGARGTRSSPCGPTPPPRSAARVARSRSRRRR
eukprot:1186291-Prorocentrum_minimum.AAC.3